MKAEDYLDFEAEGGQTIRFRGSRISIYIIAEDFNSGKIAQEIFEDYSHSLSLEAIHFGIAYYLRNKAKLDADMEMAERATEEIINRPENLARLRKLRESSETRETREALIS